jgi:uncharacterized protein YndB with AHSA1/START domain
MRDESAVDPSVPASARELTITRVFDAPARLLFEAYARPEHIKKWFGPVGWPVTKAEMDFRVGGEFHFAMTGPDGAAGPPFGGTYREIVPGKRIVYDNGFEQPTDPSMEGRMVVTVTFDEQAGKTTLTIHTLFETVAMYRFHTGHGYEEGVGSGLDQLGELVASMR